MGTADKVTQAANEQRFVCGFPYNAAIRANGKTHLVYPDLKVSPEEALRLVVHRSRRRQGDGGRGNPPVAEYVGGDSIELPGLASAQRDTEAADQRVPSTS